MSANMLRVRDYIKYFVSNLYMLLPVLSIDSYIGVEMLTIIGCTNNDVSARISIEYCHSIFDEIEFVYFLSRSRVSYSRAKYTCPQPQEAP